MTGKSATHQAAGTSAAKPTRTVSRGAPRPQELGEELLERLSKRVDVWMEVFGWLLIPPFSDFRPTELLKRIRSEFDVEAASLFLTGEGNPNQLRCVADVGYDADYQDKVYYLHQPALTPYVFSQKTALNESASRLDPAWRKAHGLTSIPFTGNCARHIETKQFRNIIAVAVVFEKNPIGVLKLENKKGTTEEDKFSSEDFTLAKTLAHMIAIAIQQGVYTRLWTKGESIAATARTQDEYLEEVAKVLREALNAECCSFFIREPAAGGGPGSVLRYAAGVGYKEAYLDHVYELPGDAGRATTAYLAKHRDWFHGNEAELSDKLPYSGRCREYITSGTFRNFLGIALVEEGGFGKPDAPCWGVLKLENRKPEGTDFGNYDLEVCKSFVVKQIVPALKRLEKSPLRRRASGSMILRKELGEPVPRGSHHWNDRLTEVLKAQSCRPDEITDQECADYLGVKRLTYWRRKRDSGFTKPRKRR